MIPPGFRTLRELHDLATHEELKTTDPDVHWSIVADGVAEQLCRMIRDCQIVLFVERDGRIYRIPNEDIRELEGYCLFQAVSEGFFPRVPTPEDLEEEAAERAKDPADKAYGDLEAFAAVLACFPHLEAYCNTRPFVKVEHVQALFPETTPVQKSGAPGRPSSRNLVMIEHARRVVDGEAADSREKEARELEAWLRGNSPEAPPLTWKTIRKPAANVPAQDLTKIGHEIGPEIIFGRWFRWILAPEIKYRDQFRDPFS
jgi:hypothetical protein